MKGGQIIHSVNASDRKADGRGKSQSRISRSKNIAGVNVRLIAGGIRRVALARADGRYIFQTEVPGPLKEDRLVGHWIKRQLGNRARRMAIPAHSFTLEG